MKHYSQILGIDLANRTKQREYTAARQAVWYFLKKRGYAETEIARMFGYNHGTVFHGISVFNDLLETKNPLAVKYWDALMRRPAGSHNIAVWGYLKNKYNIFASEREIEELCKLAKE